MRTLIFLGLFLCLVAGCADPRSVGTLVHEGPVALDRDSCFAAFDDEGHLVWVDLATKRRARGPAMAGVHALAYDRHRALLLALTATEIQSLPIGSHEVVSSTERRGAEQVWPLADGWLVGYEDGLWSHEPASGSTIWRTLPRARSMWERHGNLEWLGDRHPREVGPVLIQTDAEHPLAAPAVVALPDPSLPGDTRVAPHDDDQLVVAVVAPEGLRLSSPSHDLTVPLQAKQLEALMWLGATHYLVVLDDPAVLLIVDMESNQFQELDSLQGPVAGPFPCAAEELGG